MFMVSREGLRMYGIWEEEFEWRVRDLIRKWG